MAWGAGDWTESGLDWWNGGEAVNWSQGSHAVFQEPGGTVKAYERGPTMQMPIISSTLMDSAISWGELKKTGAGTDGGGSMPRLRWHRRISTGPDAVAFREGGGPLRHHIPRTRAVNLRKPRPANSTTIPIPQAEDSGTATTANKLL